MGVDNEPVLRQEFIGNLYGRLQIATRVATQVDGQIPEVLLRQTGERNQQLRVSVLTKVPDADVTCFLVEHVGGCDALSRYLSACDHEFTYLFLAIAHYA